MSDGEWLFRLDDLAQSAARIVDYTANLTREEFLSNPMVMDAVVRNLEVIGEAANRIPEDFRKRFPDILWQQMRGMRNRLIHDYSRVDSEILWQTVQTDIRLLLPAIERARLAARTG